MNLFSINETDAETLEFPKIWFDVNSHGEVRWYHLCSGRTSASLVDLPIDSMENQVLDTCDMHTNTCSAHALLPFKDSQTTYRFTRGSQNSILIFKLAAYLRNKCLWSLRRPSMIIVAALSRRGCRTALGGRDLKEVPLSFSPLTTSKTLVTARTTKFLPVSHQKLSSWMEKLSLFLNRRFSATDQSSSRS